MLCLLLELHVKQCMTEVLHPRRMVKAAGVSASATPESFTQAHVTFAPDNCNGNDLAAEQFVLWHSSNQLSLGHRVIMNAPALLT